MSSITLRERDFEQFFQASFSCYRSTSHYVSPMKSDLRRFLDESRNPLFRDHGAFTFFTAHRGSDVAGRIVAHIHHDSNRVHALNRSYFGYFDCADDDQVAAELLGAAEAWGRAQGCAEIGGNFNLTAMQQLGVVTDGFDGIPYTDMQYNPPHIPRLLERNGYQPFFPMTTYEMALEPFDPASLLGEKQRALLSDARIRWTQLRRRGFHRLMQQTREVLNAAFAANPMFVPLTEAEFLFQVKEMMWIVDDRIASLVYRGSEAIGVLVCIPDLNPFVRATKSRFGWATPFQYLRFRGRRRRAVIIFAAVRPEFHNHGLTGAMLFHITRALKAAGYTHLGITWIADTNPASLRQMAKLNAHPLHRLHLYRKALT